MGMIVRRGSRYILALGTTDQLVDNGEDGIKDESTDSDCDVFDSSLPRPHPRHLYLAPQHLLDAAITSKSWRVMLRC